MSGFVRFVFVSLQIALFGKLSNGHLATTPQELFHVEVYPNPYPQKCCSATHIYSFTGMNCSSLTDQDQLLTGRISMQLPFLNLTSTIGCATGIILDIHEGHNYTLLQDGMLYEHKRNKTHDHDHFCMEYVVEFARFVPIVCLDKSELEESAGLNGQALRFQIQQPESFVRRYSRALIFSSIFLMITLCTYLVLPELHRYEFDWSLIGHIASLIIGFGCTLADYHVSPNDAACVPLGYMRQFWMLSSFCWLNVMGIYLWRSMYTEKRSGTFPIICLYAVGFPVFIFIVTFLSNKWSIVSGAIKPGFEKNCWFQSFHGDFWLNPKFIYFYNTIFATIIVNLGLFTIIAFKILFQNPGWIPTVDRNQQKYDLFHTRLFLCLKLSFAMGLSWTADLVSLFVKEEELQWSLKNLAVLLHGICIFLIFVNNERVTNSLLRRYSIGKRFKSLQVEKKVLFIPDNTVIHV